MTKPAGVKWPLTSAEVIQVHSGQRSDIFNKMYLLVGVCVWGVCGWGVWGWVCVGGLFVLAFKARTRINFFTFKVRTFWQSEFKISVLALWLCALSSLFHKMGVGRYGRFPLFVRARHVQRCVKKCPHFEYVIHRFVLALNAGTDTLYTCVYPHFKCRGR